jgi:alkylation response protein AidB-like acyl-CoA dehydrogenase
MTAGLQAPNPVHDGDEHIEPAAASAEDLNAIRDMTRAFLEEISNSRDVSDDIGFDRTSWMRMGHELGVLGLAISADYGGGGYGLVELSVVLEEMGRALYSGPFFSSSVIAATLIQQSGSHTVADLLGRIAAGDSIATAVLPGSNLWGMNETGLIRAYQDGGEWRLSGECGFVLYPNSADAFVVLAETGGGIGLFVVTGSNQGLSVEMRQSLDMTRRLGEVRLTSVVAMPLAFGMDAQRALASAMEVALVGLAAEEVGGCQAVLDGLVDYSLLRHQFGRPIGSFQSTKHRLAEAYADLEMARSALQIAVASVVSTSADRLLDALVAKWASSAAYLGVAKKGVQVLGAIGFTDEHWAHRHLKRAKLGTFLLGTHDSHSTFLWENVFCGNQMMFGPR